MDNESLAILEEVADISEEMATTMEEMRTKFYFLRKADKNKIIFCGLLAASGVALAAGTAGWLLAEKRLKTKYEEISNKEIAEAKVFYSRLQKPETVDDAVKSRISPSLESAAAALSTYQTSSDATVKDEVEEPEETVEVEVSNVFETSQEGVRELSPDERADRVKGRAYIVDVEEFMQNEKDYNQVTLTYYEGDGVLVDENEEAIPDPIPIVGDALEHFGHGSGDANTVFSRNDRLSLDFEIVRSDGKYAHEVLGFQHSDLHGSRQRDRHERRNQTRKFRDSDE